MFFNRRDGKKIKGLKDVDRLMPLFLKGREGNVNKYVFKDDAKYFDEYIERKRAEGINYTYRDLCVAVLVRGFYMHPKLNRFIVANRYYQRNSIDFAMMVHKSLKGDTPEISVKVRYTGQETLKEIKGKLDDEIMLTIKSTNESDKTAKQLSAMPLFLLRMAIRTLRILDYFGLLSTKFMFKVSPFHSSIFFTDVKSIGLEYIQHHLFNFGNCGFFAALGKEQMVASVTKDGKTEPMKEVQLGISVDDRVADGLTLAYFVKTVRKTIRNLDILETPPTVKEIDG